MTTRNRDTALLPETAEAVYDLMVENAQRRNYARGEFIIEQGAAVGDIWMVLTGAARAVIFSEDGQEVWVDTFAVGDLFGHTAVMGSHPVEFGIAVDKAMTALVIPATAFEMLLNSEDHLSRSVATNLADRLNAMTLRMFELATLSAPARIGMELLRMAQPSGVHEHHRIIRPVPVLSNMAMKVQSTRETVSRTVSRLQKLGLITRQPGAIIIEDEDSLREKLGRL